MYIHNGLSPWDFVSVSQPRVPPVDSICMKMTTEVAENTVLTGKNKAISSLQNATIWVLPATRVYLDLFSI